MEEQHYAGAESKIQCAESCAARQEQGADKHAGAGSTPAAHPAMVLPREESKLFAAAMALMLHGVRLPHRDLFSCRAPRAPAS